MAISMYPELSARIDGPAGQPLDAWSNTLVASVMRILWEDPAAWADEGMKDRAERARAIRSRRAAAPTLDLRTATVRAISPPPVPSGRPIPEPAAPARRLAERVA